METPSAPGFLFQVRRDALKCQLELCGQPEQVGKMHKEECQRQFSRWIVEVVDAESFCEETVRQDLWGNRAFPVNSLEDKRVWD